MSGYVERDEQASSKYRFHVKKRAVDESAETSSHNLSIACFNTQSMCNKVSGVTEMLKDRKIDICCVTETWFKSKDSARFAEIHDYGYDVISAPRRGIGGGVAFVFNPKTISPIRNNVTGFKSFEVVECVIKTAEDLLRLSVVYRSTQAKSKLKYEETKLTTFFDEFDEYFDSVMNKSGAPVICGDFNFHVEDDNNAYYIICKQIHFSL